jgi:hypothetical protein
MVIVSKCSAVELDIFSLSIRWFYLGFSEELIEIKNDKFHRENSK